MFTSEALAPLALRSRWVQAADSRMWPHVSKLAFIVVPFGIFFLSVRSVGGSIDSPDPLSIWGSSGQERSLAGADDHLHQSGTGSAPVRVKHAAVHREEEEWIKHFVRNKFIRWCSHDPTLPHPQTIKRRFFIAANFCNSEAVLPNFIVQTLRLASRMPRGSVYISVYESNSHDASPQLLREYEAQLTSLGIPHSIVWSGRGGRFIGNDRIKLLARFRNEALAPLLARSAKQRAAAAVAQQVANVSEGLAASGSSNGSGTNGSVDRVDGVPGAAAVLSAALSSDKTGPLQLASRWLSSWVSSGWEVAAPPADAAGARSHGLHTAPPRVLQRKQRLLAKLWKQDGHHQRTGDLEHSGRGGKSLKGAEEGDSGSGGVQQGTAAVENGAPLGFNPDQVLFINDVFFCWEDLLRLAAYEVDIVCGIDIDGDQMPSIYDAWVTRDVRGERPPMTSPFSTDEATGELHRAGLPAPVSCCWNGMVALNAEPFLRSGLRMRTHMEGECAASECSLLCHDYRRLGYARIYMDTSVRTTYVYKLPSDQQLGARTTSWEEVLQHLKAQPLAPPSSVVQHGSNVTCCDLRPGSLYVDWDNACHPYDIFARNFTAEAFPATSRR